MTVEELLERRYRHLSRALSVHFAEPLHIVRGAGQYLYDADGRQYLDCVNNVPHVGHSHPQVVDAAVRQMRELNTNTRFLYEPLVEYAERLTALFPDPLSVCYFVNSGSEANDLALRLARTHTGRRGVVTVAGGYHGNTSALIDVSPYKFDGPGGAGRPAHVQVAPTPDPYRGPHRGADAGARYASGVREALAADEPPGVFVAEAIMGCAGQVLPPRDYLPAAYEHARAAGALCLADEVQIGFGRVGSSMWGFELSGVVPDLVSLGKPMGNGHPLGAVVTTPEVAASFENGMEYFNTFGGNPVSCAVGLAVLDVVEEEHLQRHALDVGEYLVAGSTTLARRHPSIGDVRGSGLFLGIELVDDPDTRTPATTLARTTVAELRRQGILLSTEGPGDNVLKLKPPLCFTHADADHLLEALDSLLP